MRAGTITTEGDNYKVRIKQIALQIIRTLLYTINVQIIFCLPYFFLIWFEALFHENIFGSTDYSGRTRLWTGIDYRQGSAWYWDFNRRKDWEEDERFDYDEEFQTPFRDARIYQKWTCNFSSFIRWNYDHNCTKTSEQCSVLADNWKKNPSIDIPLLQ